MWTDPSDWSDWTDDPAPVVIGCRACPEIRDLIWPNAVGRWMVEHQAAAHRAPDDPGAWTAAHARDDPDV